MLQCPTGCGGGLEGAPRGRQAAFLRVCALITSPPQNKPMQVWIWDMAAMELSSVLSHSAPIKEAKWAPDVSANRANCGEGGVERQIGPAAALAAVPSPIALCTHPIVPPLPSSRAPPHRTQCTITRAQSCTLALVVGNNKVFMWTCAGASIIHVPLRSFAAQSVRWAPSGRSFVLTDSEAFCCAYMV